MDTLDIFVIADNMVFSREDIIKIIQAEEYKHNFCFGNTLTENHNNSEREIDMADEVWCFGSVERHFEYKYAKSVGKDIWKMG